MTGASLLALLWAASLAAAVVALVGKGAAGAVTAVSATLPASAVAVGHAGAYTASIAPTNGGAGNRGRCRS